MRCQRCGTDAAAHVLSCPGCGMSLGGGELTRAGGALERALDARLARMTLEGLMEREAMTAAITLDAEIATPLAPSELQGAISRLNAASALTLDELEGALALDGKGTMLEGIRLMDFLDRGGAEFEILRKGIIFLRRKRYGPALEWWSLNRQRLRPDQGKVELLLLLMESYTHRLAGASEEAARTLARVRAHPLYPRQKGAGS
jgi:hypothetical protein